MKVIFLQNVENNQIGEVKNVKDGYARNFLLKQKIAVPATKDELKRMELRLDKLKKEEEKKIKELELQKEEIEKIAIEIKEEAGPEDEEGKRKLYGSVTSTEISNALKEKGYEIDKKDIEILEPIKELGTYEVTVKLGHGVSGVLKVKVTERI